MDGGEGGFFVVDIVKYLDDLVKAEK